MKQVWIRGLAVLANSAPSTHLWNHHLGHLVPARDMAVLGIKHLLCVVAHARHCGWFLKEKTGHNPHPQWSPGKISESRIVYRLLDMGVTFNIATTDINGKLAVKSRTAEHLEKSNEYGRKFSSQQNPVNRRNATSTHSRVEEGVQRASRAIYKTWDQEQSRWREVSIFLLI